MPEQAKHIISSYDAALYGLRNDVLMMSSLADRILQTAFEAFLTRNGELCDHVVAEDEEIDTLEKQVDQDGVALLIRFHRELTLLTISISSGALIRSILQGDTAFRSNPDQIRRIYVRNDKGGWCR
jgi:phosphate uptake regulator